MNRKEEFFSSRSNGDVHNGKSLLNYQLFRKPQVKTRIMLIANLSYMSLQQKITQLQTYDLLERHHSKETYLTTEKGLKGLHKWADLQQFLAAPPTNFVFPQKQNSINQRKKNTPIGNS